VTEENEPDPNEADAGLVADESAPTNEKIFNYDWLHTFACDLIDQLDETMPSVINAYDRGDLEQVGKHLHQIRGSGGTVGLNQLSEIASKGESAIEVAQWEALGNTLTELQDFIAAAMLEKQTTDAQPPETSASSK
jgi:two-component system sensor kinase